jgi:hypothetical protein
MVRVYQDFDENCRAMWGKWFGTLSRDGHVIMNAGPFNSEQECRAWLGDVSDRAHIDRKRRIIDAIERR